MGNFEKIDFKDEKPENSLFYYTDKGHLKYDRFTQSFYDSEGLLCKVEQWFKEIKTFDSCSRVMINHLCENYHPHVSVIITPTGSELMEGKKSTGLIMDYVKD